MSGHWVGDQALVVAPVAGAELQSAVTPAEAEVLKRNRRLSAERSSLAELRPAVRIAWEAGDTRAGRALFGVIGRECRRYLSMGGTVDELAVELGLALSLVRQLLAEPLPELE